MSTVFVYSLFLPVLMHICRSHLLLRAAAVYTAFIVIAACGTVTARYIHEHVSEYITLYHNEKSTVVRYLDLSTQVESLEPRGKTKYIAYC